MTIPTGHTASDDTVRDPPNAIPTAGPTGIGCVSDGSNGHLYDDDEGRGGRFVRALRDSRSHSLSRKRDVHSLPDENELIDLRHNPEMLVEGYYEFKAFVMQRSRRTRIESTQHDIDEFRDMLTHTPTDDADPVNFAVVAGPFQNSDSPTQTDRGDSDSSDEMPKFMGENTLKPLNLKAANINQELEDKFRKFENFFLLNDLDDTTARHRTLRAAILRQFVGDDVLRAISVKADDANTSYDELKRAIQDRFKVQLDPLVLRSQFMRCVMLPGMTSRDFMQTLW